MGIFVQGLFPIAVEESSVPTLNSGARQRSRDRRWREGGSRDRGDGWWAVPLKGFPFPLVAKIVVDEPGKRVRWVFRGFWKGAGELRFSAAPDGVMVEGFEDIGVRPLGLLSPIAERLLLDRRFRGVWRHGWRRLRKLENTEEGVAADRSPSPM